VIEKNVASNDVAIVVVVVVVVVEVVLEHI